MPFVVIFLGFSHDFSGLQSNLLGVFQVSPGRASAVRYRSKSTLHRFKLIAREGPQKIWFRIDAVTAQVWIRTGELGR